MQVAIDRDMTEPLPSVRDDIIAYERAQADMEAKYLGKWVLFHDRVFVDVFDTFDQAARIAVEKFGRGPYLIRRVGAHSVTLPTSVMYGPLHAINVLRV